MQFYPYEKGGGGRSLSHAEGGGGTNSFRGDLVIFHSM